MLYLDLPTPDELNALANVIPHANPRFTAPYW